MVEQEIVQRVLAALDEQIRDFDDIVNAREPDRLPRWKRATTGILANEVSPEEAADFESARRPFRVPRYGGRSSPFELPAKQRQFLQNLRDDIARNPAKHLRRRLQ